VFSAYYTKEEGKSSEAFKAISNAILHGIDMYGHPHRNCNEPCKLWCHTPGKSLRVASSKCRQKISCDKRSYSWQLLSVDRP